MGVDDDDDDDDDDAVHRKMQDVKESKLFRARLSRRSLRLECQNVCAGPKIARSMRFHAFRLDLSTSSIKARRGRAKQR